MSVGDAMRSLRAIRRFRSDPVSAEDLRELVAAATQASSAENEQRWAFVVITDREQLEKLGAIYRRLGEMHIRDLGLGSGKLPPETKAVYELALGLAERMADVPAAIMVCASEPLPKTPIDLTSYFGSIYPAVQNLMLAARERGLGSTLTTLHKAADDEVNELLGLPDGVETIALIPIGYPVSDGVWERPKRRKPVEDVMHRDRWSGR